MRSRSLLLALLLAACGHPQSGVSGLEPGLDVAKAALRGGSPETALQLADNVLARDPRDDAALVVQGDALTDLGRLSEAYDSYNRALQADQDSVGAIIGVGRIRLTDDPAAASVLFLQALRHNPRNTTALTDLGVARDLMGDHPGAQLAYRQALGIDPEDSAAQINLALSMAMSGAAADAVRMLRPMASDPNASRKLKHDLAAALTMAGDREEAARILSKDLSPDDVRQALDDYAAARSGGAISAAAGGSQAALALTSSIAAPAPSAAPVPVMVASTAPIAAPAQATAAAPIAVPAPAAAPAASPAPIVPTAPVAPVASVAPAAAPTPAAPPPALMAAPAEVPAAAPVDAAESSMPAKSTESAVSRHVQLASLPSEQEAHAEWRRLRSRMPVLFADRQPVFIKAERNGHTYWLIRTGGFADGAQARAFCQQVQAAGTGCYASAM